MIDEEEEEEEEEEEVSMVFTLFEGKKDTLVFLRNRSPPGNQESSYNRFHYLD